MVLFAYTVFIKVETWHWMNKRIHKSLSMAQENKNGNLHKNLKRNEFLFFDICHLHYYQSSTSAVPKLFLFTAPFENLSILAAP